MKFIQLYTLSTGYVEGSIPPRFDPAAVKPIHKLGSDGVYIIDGRMNLYNALREGHKVANARGAVGFSLHKGQSFSNNTEWHGYVKTVPHDPSQDVK